MNEKANEFKDWMDARGLKTKSVAPDLHVDEATIRNWRSQGVPPRRLPHVERYMRDWIDTATPSGPVISDDAVSAFAASHQNLVLHPTEDQFDAWTSAFKQSSAPNLKSWALRGLDEMAAQTPANRLSVATEESASAANGTTGNG